MPITQKLECIGMILMILKSLENGFGKSLKLEN